LLQEDIQIPSKAFVDSVKQSIREYVEKGSNSVEKGNLFLKWVVTRLFDASDDEIANQITDGKNDMGIDAWLKPEIESDEGGIIQLFQLKYGESHGEKEILQFKENVKKFLKMDIKEIQRDDMKRLQQMIIKEKLDYELYYITDQNVKSKNTQRLKIYGIDQIVEELWDEIIGLPKGKIEQLTLDEVLPYGDTIIGVVSLEQLTKFIHKTKSYIYESNIRKYLQRTKVNKNLRTTLEDEPEKVFYYNNGITIVVKKFSVNANEIELYEPQIVNGAQTSSTIYDTLSLLTNAKGSILVTIIKETDKTTREDITKFRNSQNAVKGKDLISLKMFHTRIRGQLKQVGYYYEQQAGGWISMEKSERNSYTGHDLFNSYLPKTHDHAILAKDAIQAMVSGIFQNPTKPYSSIASFMPNGTHYNEVFDERLKEDYRLLLYPYLIKCYSEQLGYGEDDAKPEQKRYARLLFVTAYFKILFDYILKQDPDEIKKDPTVLDKYFKNFEANKKLLEFTNSALEYYFHRARSYLQQKEIPSWHNFFSKYSWDEELQQDFKNYVNDYPDKLKDIKLSF